MYTLILILQFAAFPGFAELDGMSANLDAGQVRVEVPGFPTRAACKAAVAGVPAMFEGVTVTVKSDSCEHVN